jgi:hypothetical protein
MQDTYYHIPSQSLDPFPHETGEICTIPASRSRRNLDLKSRGRNSAQDSSEHDTARIGGGLHPLPNRARDFGA